MEPNQREFAREISDLAEHHSAFEQEMAKRLRKKAERGWRGWNDPANTELLKRKLIQNLQEGDFVDAANLCGFLDEISAGGLEIAPEESVGRLAAWIGRFIDILDQIDDEDLPPEVVDEFRERADEIDQLLYGHE